MRLNIPTGITVILGLIGGVLEYLNQASFGLQAPWAQVITFGLYVLAVIGVSPLVHSAFRNALHLTPAEATVITSLAALLAAAITTFGLSGEVKGILEGVLAFLAFVGFGPAVLNVTPTPAPAPAPPAR